MAYERVGGYRRGRAALGGHYGTLTHDVGRAVHGEAVGGYHDWRGMRATR